VPRPCQHPVTRILRLTSSRRFLSSTCARFPPWARAQAPTRPVTHQRPASLFLRLRRSSVRSAGPQFRSDQPSLRSSSSYRRGGALSKRRPFGCPFGCDAWRSSRSARACCRAPWSRDGRREETSGLRSGRRSGRRCSLCGRSAQMDRPSSSDAQRTRAMVSSLRTPSFVCTVTRSPGATSADGTFTPQEPSRRRV